MEQYEPLAWKRTGKITLRCEPYLICRWHSIYEALYGLPGKRVSLGYYPTAAEAQEACEAHRIDGQKNPQAA